MTGAWISDYIRHGIGAWHVFIKLNGVLCGIIVVRDFMQKRPYEKPVLEICGSMIEQTLCDDDCGSHCIGGGTGFRGGNGGKGGNWHWGHWGH